MQIYTQMLTVKILWKIVFYWFKVDISLYLLIIYFRNAYSELPLMISINPQSHCIHQLTLCLLPDWLMECEPLCDWLVTSHRSVFAA